MKMDATPHKAANHSDFRGFLQSELVERCRRNPRYSLRAFARALQIESSALSKILRGRRRVSDAMLNKLSLQLGLGPEEVNYFRSQQAGAVKGGATYQQLTIDTFQIISDWYHYAILELMRVKDYDHRPQSIANRLGITINEVHAALERLQRVGIIKLDADGKLMAPPDNHTHVKDGFTDAAVRNFQRTMLEKAMECLEQVPIAKRDNTGMTMAISTSRLPEAKNMIKKFRRELCSFLEQEPEKDEVYQLTVALFPLSRTLPHVVKNPEVN